MKIVESICLCLTTLSYRRAFCKPVKATPFIEYPKGHLYFFRKLKFYPLNGYL